MVQEKAAPKAKRKAPHSQDRTEEDRGQENHRQQGGSEEARPASLVVKAQENARNVFLAGLGFYGMAADEAQSQYEDAQTRMKQRQQRPRSCSTTTWSSAARSWKSRPRSV